MITIDQFLTPAEIEKACRLYSELKDTGTYAKTIETEIIEPNIERINQALGQENHAGYLAYAVEYVMMRGDLANFPWVFPDGNKRTNE